MKRKRPKATINHIITDKGQTFVRVEEDWNKQLKVSENGGKLMFSLLVSFLFIGVAFYYTHWNTHTHTNKTNNNNSMNDVKKKKRKKKKKKKTASSLETESSLIPEGAPPLHLSSSSIVEIERTESYTTPTKTPRNRIFVPCPSATPQFIPSSALSTTSASESIVGEVQCKTEMLVQCGLSRKEAQFHAASSTLSSLDRTYSEQRRQCFEAKKLFVEEEGRERRHRQSIILKEQKRIDRLISRARSVVWKLFPGMHLQISLVITYILQFVIQNRVWTIVGKDLTGIICQYCRCDGVVDISSSQSYSSMIYSYTVGSLVSPKFQCYGGCITPIIISPILLLVLHQSIILLRMPDVLHIVLNFCYLLIVIANSSALWKFVCATNFVAAMFLFVKLHLIKKKCSSKLLSKDNNNTEELKYTSIKLENLETNSIMAVYTFNCVFTVAVCQHSA